ncbi:hypothetical protein WMY93_015189 [Mugilogobius chulae]|uniref:Uncharacterized protein n=1 Tax=Mugilogobius chulae TaxID=88201 RepID=A0AAW0P8T3_9GOBI
MLDRFYCMGYYLILLLGKKKKGKLAAEVLYSLGFKVPPPIESRLLKAFEAVIQLSFEDLVVTPPPIEVDLFSACPLQTRQCTADDTLTSVSFLQQMMEAQVGQHREKSHYE